MNLPLRRSVPGALAALFFLSSLSLVPARAASDLPAASGWEYSLADEELESAWSWKVPLQASGAFETRIVFHYQSPQEYALLRIFGDDKNAQLRFWRMRNGQFEKWGEPESSIAFAGEGELTLQRTPWRARALWNGRVVTSAYDVLEGEGFSVAQQGAVKLGEARMQPTEPPFLRDDFMRAGGPDEPEVASVWQPVSGEWKTSGLLNKRADSSLNPNPFVFRSENKDSKKESIAQAGYWWWNDYTMTVSLRPALLNRSEPLQAGLMAYSDKATGGVAGIVDFQKRRASIVIGGRTVATGAPFALDAGQWHRLFLDPGPGTVRLLVDGVERVRATDEQLAGHTEPAQGEAALISLTGGGNFVDFDDVRIAPNNALRDNFQVAAVGRWEDAIGTWQTQTKHGARAKLTAGVALTLTGEDDREEGHVEASFKSEHPFGIAFGARDAKNYFLARVRGDKLEIVEYSNGAGKIVGAVKLPGSAKPEIEVDWRDGLISTQSGGVTATAVVTSVPAGRVGAWADGAAKATNLLSFRALGAAPGWGEAALPEVFQKDRLMKNWASNAQAWSGGENNTWWHTGDFFGDAALQLPLPEMGENKKISLLLKASPQNPEAGTRLEVQRHDKKVSLQLSEAGQQIKAVTIPLDEENEDAPVLRIARRPLEAGRVSLRAALDDKTVLSETASTPVGGEANNKVGVRLVDTAVKTKPAAFTISLTLAEQEGNAQMGVSIAPLTEAIQKLVGLQNTEGVYLEAVVPDSPAAKAGMKTGDVILSIKAGDKETKITKPEDLVELVKGMKAGQQISVQLWRNPQQAGWLEWEDVVATTSNVLDYTFTNAPVDWYASQGRWEVAERWTCSPQWGFFSGSASAHPTLWSRYATVGDWTLEAYLATPMDLARGERSPMDLNVTVDADGHDLASGYSFLFGAEKRTQNQVWRGDQKVLAKPFELPKGAGSTHQDWFYVRIERRHTADKITYRYSVNGQQVAEYSDPQPLPGVLETPRHLAFWTYNGALSIARVRLWNSGLRSGAAENQPAPMSAVQAIGNDLGEWRPRLQDGQPASATLEKISDEGQPAVAITNQQSGGDWTVYATDKPFNAKDRPQLRFDYRVPKNVRVNLYALVADRWREIIFAGEPEATQTTPAAEPNDKAPTDPNTAAIVPASFLKIARTLDPKVTIGTIEGVQKDGQWHTAQFDLLAALQNAGLDTKVDALALAAPSQDYLYAGLGGNHRGATYWIRDLQAPVVKNQTVAENAPLKEKSAG